MSEPSSDDSAVTSAEAEEELEVQRAGDPYLVYRDGRGQRRLLSLPAAGDRIAVGRSLYSDLVLNWDKEVSTVHAELESLADDWFLIDDGMSRNGSFVNGQPVRGRRRLLTGDVIRVGSTTLVFRSPYRGTEETMTSREVPEDLGSP